VLERSFRRWLKLPLYEYECPKHGTFERMQKFSDPPVTACPVCGGPVEKLLSAPAIQFKGTGWYVTDYARKSTGEGKEKGAAKEKSGSTEAKGTSSETKVPSSGSDEKKQ
jgi:putative FmdB family regulatory protein